MRVTHEAIYQALFVQGPEVLRRQLTACLRLRPRGRARANVTPMPGAAAFMRPFVWACALPELNDGFEIIQRLRLLAWTK